MRPTRSRTGVRCYGLVALNSPPANDPPTSDKTRLTISHLNSNQLVGESWYLRSHGRKNCMDDASLGRLNGVADFGSGLNLEKTNGLSRKCVSSVCILLPLAG